MEDELNPHGISGLGRITARSSLKGPKQKKPNFLRSHDEDDWKRNQHKNKKEQKRRAELNDGFHSLRSLIPGLETTYRAAKLTILDKASRYCQSLTAKGQLYEMNIVALKNEQKKLRERISLLKRKT